MRIKFFKYAKKIAANSTSRVRLGCVIVNRNKIIGHGKNNMEKTHPASPNFYKYLHAEIAAIIKSNRDMLRGAILYVYRESKLGVPVISRPCTSCYEAIKLAQIKKICYTDNGQFVEEFI